MSASARDLGEKVSMLEDMLRWSVDNPRVARKVAGDYRRLRIRLAQDDVNEFIEFVLRDEATGKPVVQAPMHEEFQTLADRYDRLILWGMVESGKTSALAVGRTLWRLGRDHNLRVAIVSSAQKNQAGKIVANLQAYIKKSRDLHAVFPGLRPGRHWTSNSFTVDRTVLSKDPTVQATSIETGSLTGSRIDLMIIDDVLNHDNTRTADGRAKTVASLGSSTFIGRMTATSQILFLGNAFHPDDAMHAYAKNPSWHFAKFPVQLSDGTLTWPERWPQSRIDKRRGEMHPDEVARQLFCIARDDSAGRFKRAWIHQCMDRGAGKKIAHSLNSLPPGYACFTGVDLGVRKKAGSDFTVLFTIVVHPNEDREVICCESGRWAGNEIVNRIIDTHRRYNSIIYVENNGAQQYILDFTKDQSAVPCRPLFTGKNKVHPDFGIEGLATEMSNSKWIVPSYGDHRAHPELMLWADELVYYDPSAHSGDRLMASWIAREGAREWKKRPKIQQGSIQLQAR